MTDEKNLPIEEEAEIETASPSQEAAEETPKAGQELTGEEKLQKELDELNDKHLRLMAEYDNFRKRTQREKDDLYASVTATTVEKFLPVWDNFLRACAFESGSEDFAKGFELIKTNFQEVLAKLGVEAFGVVGDAFDPNQHYAVSHIEDEELGTNVVSQVMQTGYRIKDRIIRYAMVQTAN